MLRRAYLLLCERSGRTDLFFSRTKKKPARKGHGVDSFAVRAFQLFEFLNLTSGQPYGRTCLFHSVVWKGDAGAFVRVEEMAPTTVCQRRMNSLRRKWSSTRNPHMGDGFWIFIVVCSGIPSAGF